MSQTELAVNFFVALFALIDPVGNVAVFAAATGGASNAVRRTLAVYIGLFSAAFLTFFFLTGLSLLDFFGISLPAFRIAGGAILFLMGLDMVRDDFTAKFTDAAEIENAKGPKTTKAKENRAHARARFERLVVPVAMPLLIGPGAISTVVIYASDARPFGVAGWVLGMAVILAVSATIIISFWATPLISRLLGRIGLTIVVRVLGLILCALAVQFVIAGVLDVVAGRAALT